ncbi:MAG: hypothetical protein ACJAU1_001717, partial [Psychromonas sp.]
FRPQGKLVTACIEKIESTAKKVWLSSISYTCGCGQ